MRKKILITGASGFIGSFLAEEALLEGYVLYAGVREGSSRQYLMSQAIRFFPMDLSSEESLTRGFINFNQQEGGFDYIIHNAGITREAQSGDFYRVNDHYTRNLASAILSAGKLPEKFIFISSLAVKGPGDPVLFTPIRPSDPDQPVSTYARSKLAAEKYLQSLEGFPLVIVRPTAVYGPRDRDFLTFFRIIQKGIEPYTGWKKQMISLIYVKDLARLVFRIVERAPAGSVYLIGDQQAYRQEDIGAAIKKVLGRKALRIRLPLVPLRALIWCTDTLGSLFGHPPFLNREKFLEMTASNWLCHTGSLWQDMDMVPGYSLESGIRETADWYRQQGWLS